MKENLWNGDGSESWHQWAQSKGLAYSLLGHLAP